MALTDEDGWVARDLYACISLASGCTPERLRDVLVGEPLREFPSESEADAWVLDSDRYDRCWSAFGRHHGVAIAWEDNGFAGSDVGRALSLSDDGAFASMYWNVNAVMEFTHASGGRLVRRFDPLFHDDPDDQDGEPLPAEAGLDWSAAPIRSGLSALSRLFGVPPIRPRILRRPGMRFFGYRL